MIPFSQSVNLTVKTERNSYQGKCETEACGNKIIQSIYQQE